MPGTLIVQSAPAGPPGWLERCMASVKAWSAIRGHAYHRVDAVFFDIVPEDIRTRLTMAARIPLSDIARLLWIARGFADGHDRVAWIDSDILVFDADTFVLPDDPFACGRELWVWAQDGALRTRDNPTNALLAFTTRAGLLDWYLNAAHRILREAPLPVHRLALGPQLLTDVHRLRPLPLIESVATLSPLLIAETIAGGGPGLARHRSGWRARISGAHLCRSLGQTADGPALTPADAFDPAIDRLLRDGAILLNDPPAPDDTPAGR